MLKAFIQEEENSGTPMIALVLYYDDEFRKKVKTKNSYMRIVAVCNAGKNSEVLK